MLEKKKKPDQEMRNFRMDLVHQIIKTEDQPDGSHIFTAVLTPDPRKYEEIQEGGKVTGYKDKFTGLIIPLKAIEELANGMTGIPIYYSPPKKPNYCDYLHAVKKQLMEKWDTKYDISTIGRPIDGFLSSIIGTETNFVILYVDLAGSTVLSSQVDPDTNVKINKIFLMQMARVIDNFNGYVLKYVGDCVIGIFPADQNYTGMCDNAIQSSMLMCAIVEYVLNPIFEGASIPKIGCHIGLDVGNVRVDKIGDDNIGSFIDLIGYPMSLTAKIQGRAGFNDILLGNNIFELLHCSWQEGCQKVDLGKDWTFIDPRTGEKYQVYRFLKRVVCDPEGKAAV